MLVPTLKALARARPFANAFSVVVFLIFFTQG